MRLSEMCSICICRAKLLALGCTTVTALGWTNGEPLMGRGREHSIGPSVTACGQLVSWRAPADRARSSSPKPAEPDRSWITEMTTRLRPDTGEDTQPLQGSRRPFIK